MSNANQNFPCIKIRDESGKDYELVTIASNNLVFYILHRFHVELVPLVS